MDGSSMNPAMSSFDPNTVRAAVAEFTPRRPQRFQELSPAKDVILELRQKRASYRAIAELLTQHCLPTSKTAIAAYCHEVLGEGVRPRRKSARRRPDDSPALATKVPDASNGGSAAKESDAAGGIAGMPPRTRGPRIAQVRMMTPQSP